MNRIIGTTVRSLRTPIFKLGDDVSKIVVDTVFEASKQAPFEIENGDIVSVTESVVARTQGNYATIEQIATDINQKFKGDTLGLIFPILSRNRFSILLKGIAKSGKKLVMQLSYPSDEVGNALFDDMILIEKGINPYTDSFTEKEFEATFGKPVHIFTGINYPEYYREIVESVGSSIEFVFSNNPQTILDYTKNVLICDIHTRFKTKAKLETGANILHTLDDILSESVDGSGYSEYGLLGSNKASETSVKLFPRDCDTLANKIKAEIKDKSGKDVEVLIYGDGAFKDPVGKIWELADPVVGVGFTKGLDGTPNELKIKYLADDKFANLKGNELKEAIIKEIHAKEGSLYAKEVSEGTTPRRLTDLIGSLCDLTSGSGDKGTPVIYIKGYFDNYATE